MQRLLQIAAFGLITIGATPPALAYQCITVANSKEGVTQAWNQRCIPFKIRPSIHHDDEEAISVVEESFSQWTRHSCTDISFMNAGITREGAGFDPDSPETQENTVVFVDSEAEAEAYLSGGQLAVTLTWFAADTGEILNSDILVNYADYEFDLVEEPAPCSESDRPPYDLPNTLVHEVGHLLGFDHNASEGSTMFPTAAACETAKRSLSEDDQQAICSVYPAEAPTQSCVTPSEGYESSDTDVEDYRYQCEIAQGMDVDIGGCRCLNSKQGNVPKSWMWFVGFLLLGRSLEFIGKRNARSPRRS